MYLRFGLEPLLFLVGILFVSSEGLMDYSVLGECHAWAFHNPKMCVHEENHLVVLLHVYLLSMWYVSLMRILYSIMSINTSILFFLPLVVISWFITLWGSHILCAYYKPRKCGH